MSSPSPLTILITGANHGIGLGLVSLYLSQPPTTVIASVRSHSSASPLRSLPKAPSSRLVVIALDIASTESIKTGITSLPNDHGITSLDVVIANAGVAGTTPKLRDATISDIQNYINVNAFGQLELYKAVFPLLKRHAGSTSSQVEPKLIYMSSAGGSLQSMNTIVPLSAYRASKALANFLFKWLALEETGDDKVLVWCQHPGYVRLCHSSVCVERRPALHDASSPLLLLILQN
jgi:norsolorinic acid ketoreductase